MTRFGVLLALTLGAAPLRAQSLPLHRPLNPIASGRSALAAQPYVTWSPYGARLDVAVEYGNAIDYELAAGVPGRYLLDAELMRTSATWTRDLSPSAFIALRGEVLGSYGGFTDGFFVWYHGLIGFDQPEREARPRNTFAGELVIPDGPTVVLEPRALGLGDLRATLGLRHGLTQQTTFALVLPTALPRGELGRGAPSLGVVHTLRVEPLSRVVFEGTLGVGATPRHGVLAEYQRVFSMSGSTGLRIRLWGGQSIYGYFFYHSPYYRGTRLASLDARELTGDFGWIMRDRRGREWRVGFSEDLAPDDAGIDLILKIGRSW
jgi:hypothetical protein